MPPVSSTVLLRASSCLEWLRGKKIDSLREKLRGNTSVQWALRTALACGATSLLHLTISSPIADAAFVGQLFAPICAAICGQPTLGGTLRFSLLVSRASVAGSLLAYALLSGCGAARGADLTARLYVLLGLVSPLFLLPAFTPIATRLGWATFVGGVTTALGEGPGFDPTTALRLALSAAVGCATSALCCAPAENESSLSCVLSPFPR